MEAISEKRYPFLDLLDELGLQYKYVLEGVQITLVQISLLSV